MLQDQYLLQLCLFGHILQLLVTYDCNGVSESSPPPRVDGVDSMDTDENAPYEAPPPATPHEFLAQKEGFHSSSESDGLWLHQLFMQCRAIVGLPNIDVDHATLLTYIKDHWSVHGPSIMLSRHDVACTEFHVVAKLKIIIAFVIVYYNSYLFE